MYLLRDIAKIVKEDRERDVEVKVNSNDITVYLEYDPYRNMDETHIIPIKYDTFFQNICIPQDELNKLFKPDKGGIELSEIKLIKKIMHYMEKHREELTKLCALYDLDKRHRQDENSEFDS